MKRHFPASLLCCVLSCAAPRQTVKGYWDYVNAYTGSPADRLITAWGPPSSSYVLGDGGKVIQYIRKLTDKWHSGNDSATEATHCFTNFRIGQDGRVQEVTFIGDCRFVELSPEVLRSLRGLEQ